MLWPSEHTGLIMPLC